MSGSISVVIPFYNHANYIRDAVESVINQGSIVREIIIINDGSTDDSAAVLADVSRQDSRIVFWSQPNQGAHRTINTGLMRATSDYVTILNSDDIYAPGRLSRLVGALDRDQGADIASSSLAFIDGNGTSIANPWYADALAAFKKNGRLGTSLMHANFIMTTSNIVMRRRLLDTVGLFAPLRYAHDLDFLLRAAARGSRLAFIDAPLMTYRMHATNTIKEDPVRTKREWAIACAHHLHLVRESPHFIELGWSVVEEMIAVLDRHGLARAVQCCLLYFDRFPSDTLERSTILTDDEFNRVLVKTFT